MVFQIASISQSPQLPIKLTLYCREQGVRRSSLCMDLTSNVARKCWASEIVALQTMTPTSDGESYRVFKDNSTEKRSAAVLLQRLLLHLIRDDGGNMSNQHYA